MRIATERVAVISPASPWVSPLVLNEIIRTAEQRETRGIAKPPEGRRVSAHGLQRGAVLLRAPRRSALGGAEQGVPAEEPSGELPSTPVFQMLWLTNLEHPPSLLQRGAPTRGRSRSAEGRAGPKWLGERVMQVACTVARSTLCLATSSSLVQSGASCHDSTRDGEVAGLQLYRKCT
ncbi:hypothetical protein AAFF_G00022640 [Aldrovandia affinis]|uniref:Uncharacterized protein n=1 Tax=Aldrovandia affinis TaxID=143900 RepID=A0AAD7T723_9TELE|nr:hypothetical protein AAFF_G00022640 [Aldrovandia affinis]